MWSKQLGTIDSAGASFGYWATFAKDSGTPWVARHGLNAGMYQQEFNKWTAAGYMPTDINVAYIGSEVRYCVIYDKIANPPAWVARHGMNEAAFKNENSTWGAKRYNLKLKVLVMVQLARSSPHSGKMTETRGPLKSTASVKYWEIIADNLSKAGWSWGCVSAIDSNGRTIWIADAHRGDGKRYIVHADEKLTAFVELESAIL